MNLRKRFYLFVLKKEYYYCINQKSMEGEGEFCKILSVLVT